MSRKRNFNSRLDRACATVAAKARTKRAVNVFTIDGPKDPKQPVKSTVVFGPAY